MLAIDDRIDDGKDAEYERHKGIDREGPYVSVQILLVDELGIIPWQHKLSYHTVNDNRTIIFDNASIELHHRIFNNKLIIRYIIANRRSITCIEQIKTFNLLISINVGFLSQREISLLKLSIDCLMGCLLIDKLLISVCKIPTDNLAGI